jgi:hypothetical protein
MKTRRRNCFFGIEPLEPRLAPAGFMTYTDIDGDSVKLTRTDAGPFFGEGVEILNGQLFMLDLSNPIYQGASFTFTVTKRPLGDGLANVGRIRSPYDLGAVIVKGDLGAIEAGDANKNTPAIKLLSVRSMGRDGLATQYAPLGPDLVSEIQGPLCALRVAGDIKETFIHVIGGAAGTVGSVTVGGSLVGGSGDFSGCIFSDGDMGPVNIRGDVLSGAGLSGAIRSGGKLGAVTIGGSLIGGPRESGSIFSNGDMGPVRIGGNVLGGGNGSTPSGRISTLSNLAGVTVGGSLLGSAGDSSGEIASGGDMGLVRIGRDVVGGAGAQSGSIHSSGGLTGITLGGSLVGGAGNSSGEITSVGDMGSVKITGDLRGGSIAGTDSLSGSGFIDGRRIAGVTIGGSIFSGMDASTGTLSDSGGICAGNDIGPIVVKGSIIGHSSSDGNPPVVISARGQVAPTATVDLAIRSLTVGGRVESTLILVGYSGSLGQNADAQIGAVKIGGDWISSSLIVGASPGGDGLFGTADDAKLSGSVKDDAPISRVASVAIKGLVIGSGASGDHFGFVAEQIGSFRCLGFTAPLSAGTDFIELSPITGDVTIREIV